MSYALDDSGASHPRVAVGSGDVCDPSHLEKEGKVREVGGQAIWSLSSYKPDYGIDNLRDDSVDTYWQSEGRQPHMVNIQFQRKTTIEAIYIYVDYTRDESFTPREMSVRVGHPFHDLRELIAFNLKRPSGWVRIATRDVYGQPVRTFLVQIAVLSNHLNGQDTHLRQIKLYSPLQHGDVSVLRNVRFTSPEFRMFSCIR
ncbi:anaphase-promoting complex subunit 10-like [Amblyomma americanum]